MKSKEEKEEERQAKKERREELKEERLDRKKRHRLALGTILFDDHTYVTQVVDLDKHGALRYGDKEYIVPDIPYSITGWWPFKARSLKRAIFKDKYYNIDWIEGQQEAVDIMAAHELAEHKYILPSTFSAMLHEKGQEKMFASMKKKNKMPMSLGWIILIAVIAIVAVFILLFSGVLNG